jgi:hypothetical protein
VDQSGNCAAAQARLVDELHAVAEDGTKLLRQASNLSKLPDHVPGLGGAHFLRIQTQEPDDPNEKRARLAELIDELLEGKHDLGGVALVQAAVRRLARPVQVRVLHPDPALDRRTVSIPEMARSSGEQLTGAILLYCTLARARGRSRGLSRRASSVLILDTPSAARRGSASWSSSVRSPGPWECNSSTRRATVLFPVATVATSRGAYLQGRGELP